MLGRVLHPGTDAAYTLMRVVAGLMFAFHGPQLLFGVLSSFTAETGTQPWFGGIIELTTGLAVGIGILTSWAAFLASGTMAVAYIQFHWRFHFGASFFPAVNQGELALLYAVVFLFIACRGGGCWSVDGWRAAPGARARSST